MKLLFLSVILKNIFSFLNIVDNRMKSIYTENKQGLPWGSLAWKKVWCEGEKTAILQATKSNLIIFALSFYLNLMQIRKRQ